MKTLRRATSPCAAPVSPSRAAGVVIGGGLVVAASAAGAVAMDARVPVTVAVAVAVGAIAAVLARRTLGSLFAGVALRLARPYSPGERVRLYVPELGEIADAQVIKLGVVSTTLGTSDGLLTVANTQMLRHCA